jgi:glycosyltransferase involved in cell wall biosynthesis
MRTRRKLKSYSSITLKLSDLPLKKKILFVSNEASFTGGPIFLLKLLTHFQQVSLRYEASVFFCDGGPLAASAEKIGCNVLVSNKRAVRGAPWGKLLSRARHYYLFCKIVAKIRPDLIYSNTMLNFGEVLIGRLFGIPVVLHIHEGEKFANNFSFRLRLSCYCATRIVAGSHYAEKCLLKYSSKNIYVVYNGVSVQPIQLKVAKQKNVPLRIGSLGSIDPNKGQHLLLEASEVLSRHGIDFAIEIVGKPNDAAYFEKVKALVAKSPAKSISMISFIEDATAFLSSLDLLVVSSFDEVLPTVILEALSVGTLVVASQTGGIPEIIRDNENGFLFETGNSMELARVLKRIISTPMDELFKISRAGVVTVETMFDVKKTNESLELLVDILLKKER